jgi:hypothetical protein
MEELFDTNQMFKFWPTKKQQPKDRVLCTMRFVIYLTVILFIIRQDKRIVLLGMGIIFILYMMHTNNMIKPAVESFETGGLADATVDNFMDNKLMSNYTIGPNTGVPSNSDEEWKKIHPFLESKNWSQHNFYKVPNNNLGDFVKGAYPDMFKPTCRDDNGVCDLTTRPEYVQTRGPARRNNGLY